MFLNLPDKEIESQNLLKRISYEIFNVYLRGSKYLCMKRICVLALLCVAVVAWAADESDKKMFAYSQSIDVFASVLKELNTYYVDTVDVEAATQTAITAMLSRLDPYTVYFTEEEAKEFEEKSMGEYAGVGCTIVQRDSAVYISEPFEDTPAQECGLRAGDKIVMIDNDTVLGWKSDEVSKRMRGLPNTSLRMVLERKGEEKPVEVVLTRRLIQRNPVLYSGVLADGVGYILLETFSQQAAEEVRKALVDLKENHAINSLVLDLRDNGGGLVSEAIDIIGMFVPRGTVVLQSKGRIAARNHTYKTAVEPIDVDMPLAVLVNGYSASASEVVAGALQDLDRAVILGERSFGKGLIQQVFSLPYNRQLKVTVSYYYTPTGRSIQAVDYTRRDAEGGAVRLPDSLTNEFRTPHGRVVRDGGGITPDIEVKADTMSHLHYYLFSGHHMFDYATEYCFQHDTIASVADFYLTDDDYEDFKRFVVEREFKYDKMSNRQLKNLRELMTFEGYMDEETTSLLDTLEQRLQHNVAKDLDTFRGEIEQSLTQYIAERYYFQRGGIVIGLRNEPVSQAAVEVLLSPRRYAEILKTNQP